MKIIDYVPEGFQIYETSTGRKFVGRKNGCLFCNHCSDIFYDYNGIYALVCNTDKDIENGIQGKCEKWTKKKDLQNV